jgi:hypothetical protein
MLRAVVPSGLKEDFAGLTGPIDVMPYPKEAVGLA